MFTDSLMHREVLVSSYGREVTCSLIQCATKALKKATSLQDKDMDHSKSVRISLYNLSSIFFFKHVCSLCIIIIDLFMSHIVFVTLFSHYKEKQSRKLICLFPQLEIFDDPPKSRTFVDSQ